MRRPKGVSLVPGAWLRGAAAAMMAGAIVVACSSAGSGSGGPGQSVAAVTESPSVAASAMSSAVPSLPDHTGVPTSLDPCQLVPAQEASQLAGASFTAGEESTTEGNGKICTYGAQTTNVLMVIVGQEPDVATAQADEAAAEAQIKAQAKGTPLNITQLSGIGDGAAYMSLSELTIHGSALYALKGTIFFGFSDIVVGSAAPSQAAMQAEAQLILSRLP